MPTSFVLRAASGAHLVPARISQAFALLVKLAPSAPRGVMRGQELRLARDLAPEDDASAGFLLDFAGQGARVFAAAHGPSVALLRWAMHALAAATKCSLHEDDAPIEPAPEALREAAAAYLASYEGEVKASRRARRALDADAFVAWLAREGAVELAAGGGDFGDLPLDDAERLYEALLDRDDVADVFVSERELARMLERFNARAR